MLVDFRYGFEVFNMERTSWPSVGLADMSRRRWAELVRMPYQDYVLVRVCERTGQPLSRAMSEREVEDERWVPEVPRAGGGNAELCR